MTVKTKKVCSKFFRRAQMRNRKRVTTFYVLVLLVLSVLLLVSACAKPEPAPAPAPPPETIELRFSFYSPPSPAYDQAFAPWIDEINKRTAGRVEITTYFVGQLHPQEGSYDAVISGLADIGTHVMIITPGRFPCFDVMQVLKPDTDCDRLSPVAWELYQAFPEMQAELAETKVLTVFAFAKPTSNALGTGENPVRTLEDMKGLKIMAVGFWMQRKVQALGAAPMAALPTDLYPMLEKKVLDGGIIAPEQLESMRLRDVIGHLTLVNLGYVPFWLSMNWDVWNSLPPDIQKVFEELGGANFGDRIDSVMERRQLEAINTAINENGMELIELAPEEMARWVEATEPIRDEWVADMEAKGLPGKKLLEEADRLYAKYTQ